MLLFFALLLAPALSQAQLTDPFDTSLCPWDDFMPRAQAVDTACCSAPNSGCEGGFPSACSAPCAITFVPFADQCRDLISQYMPEQKPALESLADRCISTTNEDLFRMIRDMQDDNCCVDTSMIVPAGMQFGNVEYERDWVLVFRHDTAGGYFRDREDALSKNPNDPSAPLFSVLDTLEDYRNADNQFAFKMVWPELSPVNSNTWLQESNPFEANAGPRTEGYMPIRLHFSGDYGESNDDGGAAQLFEGLMPATRSTLADLDPGNCWWGALGAFAAHNCGIPGPVCKPDVDRHCDLISGACEIQEGSASCFADYSRGFNVGKVELWVAAPAPPPSFFQISYAGTAGCGGETVAAGVWCASIDPARLGDASSDLRSQACDASDPRQGFSYDERTMLLRVQSDPTQCVTFVHSDAHGGCEPYTLAACDEADDHQKFVLEELRNSDPAVFQWHSVAQSDEVGEVAIDLNGCSPSDGQYIWACPANANDAKHWQVRSMHVEAEADWVGGEHALYTSSDTMSHAVAQAWCVEKGGRLAVLDSEGKEGAAQQLLSDKDAWVSAYCPAEDESCGVDPPGDASGRWFWYDEVGRQVHSLAEGFVDWNGEAGARAVEGKTEWCAYHTRGSSGSWEAEACDSADKVALCEWPRDRVPGASAAAQMATIEVIQATYGGNCDGYGVQPGNENGHLRDECNGLDACDYYIDHGVIGDPAGGCPKDYVVTYDCGCGEQQAQQGGPDDPDSHEASHQTISLDCSGCSPAAEQGPFCSVSVFQHGDYGGWQADYVDGDYNGAAFLSGGARNDDASAIKVHGDGCVAVCYESDDLGASGGWEATFIEGDYAMADFLAAGAGNDQFSSMRVFRVDDCTPPASTKWRVTISSVVGAGEQVQLTEMALMEGETQLGQGSISPVVSPDVTNRGDTPLHVESSFNNGDPASQDQMNCNPLPCSFEYEFGTRRAVTAVRMSHADSPGRYPSAILVEYFRDDSWVRLEEMTMADPEFETLTDYPLSSAACSMVHNGGMPATMCTAEHPNSYYHSRACCSGQPSSDGLSCPSGDFIWCDGTNDPAMGTSKRQTCGSFVALAPAGGGHRRRQLQMFDFGNLNQHTCPFHTFNDRSAELDSACCINGDCTDAGLPPTCSFDCAIVFNSLYDDCYTLLQQTVGEESMVQYDIFADACFSMDTRSLIYALNAADCSLSDAVMDDDGWVLLLRQDAHGGGVFPSAEAVLSTNADMASEEARAATLYSNLDQIETFRGADGAFTLKLQWPDLSPINHNIWKQTNLPQTEATADYYPIEMQFDGASAEIGLAPSNSPESALMDADEGSCWWSAVGSYSAYGSSAGIPGPICRVEDPLCTEVTGDLERGAGQPCGWIAESNYFTVGIVELWVRSPMSCVGNSMCSQPAPFICSNEFALVSHVVIASGSVDTDWSTGVAEGAATPEASDPSTSKFSDEQINAWVQTFGHANVIFKVVVGGSEATARFYKFQSESQQYSSGMVNYANVCASMHETTGYVCGAERIYDGNPRWAGLCSVMNRGVRQGEDPCPGGEGGDGFQGLANPQQVYDRCAGNQGSPQGVVDMYMKVRYED